jgi:hypothetical protein
MANKGKRWQTDANHCITMQQFLFPLVIYFSFLIEIKSKWYDQSKTGG